MLGTYRGDLGGKIGWTNASETTYVGWARRNGHTLVVTILRCKPLTEMKYAAHLLNWGFAEDGRVRPVGRLVGPLPAHPAVHHPPPAHATPGALPPRARLGLPGVPLLAGLGTLVLAALTVLAVALVTRRGRQEASLVPAQAGGTAEAETPAQAESPAQTETPGQAESPPAG